MRSSLLLATASITERLGNVIISSSSYIGLKELFSTTENLQQQNVLWPGPGIEINSSNSCVEEGNCLFNVSSSFRPKTALVEEKAPLLCK